MTFAQPVKKDSHPPLLLALLEGSPVLEVGHILWAEADGKGGNVGIHGGLGTARRFLPTFALPLSAHGGCAEHV